MKNSLNRMVSRLSAYEWNSYDFTINFLFLSTQNGSYFFPRE